MEIPYAVRTLLTQLNQAGYSAYAVGGCVRDSILGRPPNDWDICTSALPEETEAVFSHYRIIETGKKHGTITVLLDGESYEVTTFRQDGAYLDHRKPEQVQFVTSLREDLARRDFTINAMAADPEGNIIDLFHGQEDLKRGCIRCVGVPQKRFEEDALRILRGLRFAAVLGFSIHPETAKAMEENSFLLTSISAERIYQELTVLLTGDAAAHVLSRYGSVLTPVLPELSCLFAQAPTGSVQQEQTIRAIALSPREPVIRWALLLQDPGAFHPPEGANNHPASSAAMARRVFARLKADKRTTEAVCTLVQHQHLTLPASTKGARRWIATLGAELALPLLEVQRCNCLAQPQTRAQAARYQHLAALREYVETLLQDSPCCSCRDLNINGRDIMAYGVKPGAEIGRLLDLLFEDVLEERCENRHQALLTRLGFHLAHTDRKDIT